MGQAGSVFPPFSRDESGECSRFFFFHLFSIIPMLTHGSLGRRRVYKKEERGKKSLSGAAALEACEESQSAVCVCACVLFS